MRFLLFCCFLLVFSTDYSSCIFGGKHTRIKYYPYHVSVLYGRGHVCSGVIIDKNSVLTAAHCIHQRNIEFLSIQAGSTIQGEGTTYKISQITEHNFNQTTKNDFDIAVLKLSTNLLFSPYIYPIKKLQEQNNEISIGTECQVTGFGTSQDEYSTHLRVITVYITSEKDCINYYETPITSNMICVRSYKNDKKIKQVLHGDSGGGLVCKTHRSYKLVGIVSFGPNNFDADAPTVFVKVSAFYNWIYTVQNQYTACLPS